MSFVASLVSFTPALQAQVAAWPFDGPSFSAAPAEMAAAAAKIKPEKFAPVTVLYEEDKDVLDEAGRLTHSHRLVYRIESHEGAESWSEAAVEWESFYQKQPVIRARVIRSDSTIELDEKTITDVPARNEEGGTYSDDRVHKAPLPGLNVGAIVEEETTSIDKEPYFSGGGVYRTYFQREVPIVRSRLIIESPLTLPFAYRVGFLPDVVVAKEEKDGVRRLVFDQGTMPPYLNSDINLATSVPRLAWVEFSTGKSWQSVADAYRALAEPQIQTDQVKAMVANAAGGDRLAKIQALVSRLHREVRYTGIEFGQSKLQPQQPSEVLKRHYGDCKDKASLLVAMLRASGIPADIALLNAGPGRDVTPDLPGMNQFDHAIVYVPATAAGDKSFWIDATAEFTRVGDLPYGDQGRLALIIAEGSQGLTETPEAHPEDSVLIETREFKLADYGPGDVIETSQTTGHIDSAFRADYGEEVNKRQRDELENYARTAYAAKTLNKIEHGDAKDFTKPFFLRLEMNKAARGNTGIDDAAVEVYPTGTFSNLPRWFAVDPESDSRKLTDEEESEKQKAQQQRSAAYEVAPFICERRYKITPPAGFVLRSLPPDKTTVMGPASLKQTYTVDSAGIVTAVLRFNTGKTRYTADEALALRKAVIAANKEDAVVVQFDQAGAKLLAAGQVREALAADQKMIDTHPREALPHARMASALLYAGVGGQARAEALKAGLLDARSVPALITIGWTKQFNEIGAHFGEGFDLAGALDAYRKALAIDPDDLQVRANLAILSEYDAKGVRYTRDADLKGAIREYLEIKKLDKATGMRYEDNILFDLLYSHQYKELLAELDTLPASTVNNGLGISATAATEGIDPALKRAERIAGDASQRSAALRNAGAQLINLRLYPLAAQALTASIQGQNDATVVARQAEVFRNLQPYVQHPQDATPAGVVRRMLEDSLLENVTDSEITKLLSRNSFATEAAWQKSLKQNQKEAGTLRGVSERGGFTPSVLADLTLGTMKLSSQGDDATGYKVTVQSIGSTGQQFFVTKQDGAYQIVASQGDVATVGNAALYDLHHGREAEARALLDWKRDLLHRGGGDDQLQGPLLPRFWTSGESKGTRSIELAAASLLVSTDEVVEMLPTVAAARDKWTPADGKPDQTDLNLLLADGYYRAGNAEKLEASSEALLKDYPDSVTALHLAENACTLNHKWDKCDAMIDARLAKHPGDRELLILKSRSQQDAGNFAGARKTMRLLLDSGNATSNDYNNYSWNALFEHAVDADAIQAAQQANMLSKNANFNDLHTLACLYAAEGKTTEAKQVLLQAMAAINLSEPNAPAWFAFGAIYEQYGLKDAAIDAYRKVEKPDGPIEITATYLLAQEHLKGLHAGL